MSGSLYVLEFADGTIKVGRSRQAAVRVMSSSVQVCANRRTALVRQWVSDRHRGYVKTERKLIEWAWKHGRPISGYQELLAGLTFEKTVTAAQAVIRKWSFDLVEYRTQGGTTILAKPPDHTILDTQERQFQRRLRSAILK